MSEEVVTGAPVGAFRVGRAVGVRLPDWASIIFGAIMLLLVLGVLARPSVFPDTAAYMASGSNFWTTVAAAVHPEAPAKPVSAALVKARHADVSLAITELSSRRPWYGVFAWPIEQVGTLWLLAAIQSGIAAWLIWISWRILAPGAPGWTAYAVQGVTAAFSTLPLIAGLAMPDVFGSVMVIAVTLLLVARDRLHRDERTGLVAIICFAVMAHGSHVLLAGAMAVLGGLMAFRAGAARSALFAVICGLGLGIAANALYDMKINLIYRQAPGRPPFLAVRLIADGPGRTYLREACAHAEPYLLCRHKAGPLNDAQAMLWSLNRADSIFVVSSVADRQILQRQEGRFVIGTILHDPAGVASAAAANWIKQLGMVYAEAPLVDQRIYLGQPEKFPVELPRTTELYTPTWDPEHYRNSLLPGMIRRVGDCMGAGQTCQPRLTMAGAARLQIAEFLGACVALAIIAIRMARRPPGDRLWLQALGVLTFAVVINALICGALAGPFPRYQSAVSWLAVMMAAIGACPLFGKSGGLVPDAGLEPATFGLQNRCSTS